MALFWNRKKAKGFFMSKINAIAIMNEHDKITDPSIDKVNMIADFIRDVRKIYRTPIALISVQSRISSTTISQMLRWGIIPGKKSRGKVIKWYNGYKHQFPEATQSDAKAIVK